MCVFVAVWNLSQHTRLSSLLSFTLFIYILARHDGGKQKKTQTSRL